jgi:hypothetical protein
MNDSAGKLQRFGVHPWQTMPAEKIVASKGYSSEDGFFLALALVFNDLKGIVLYEAQLHPHQPESVNTAGQAQWMGVIIQTRRLATGIICELLKLIETHKAVLATARFRKILEATPPEARKSWDTLTALALGNDDGDPALAAAIKRIRNQGAFHYYDPKDLTRGYQQAYFQNGLGEEARASVGLDWEATRYFFADEAAAALMMRAASEKGIDDYQKRLGDVIRTIASALAAVVTLHLVERRDGVLE